MQTQITARIDKWTEEKVKSIDTTVAMVNSLCVCSEQGISLFEFIIFAKQQKSTFNLYFIPFRFKL